MQSYRVVPVSYLVVRNHPRPLRSAKIDPERSPPRKRGESLMKTDHLMTADDGGTQSGREGDGAI